jgi:hypothetical protein
MTTIQSDKTTRKTSVPFVATPFANQFGTPYMTDYIRIQETVYDALINPLYVMRLSKPERGNLMQAYLNLIMTVSSSVTVKVGIGRFDTDGLTVITPTQAEIDASHLLLNKTISPIASSGTSLIIDGLNMISQIPQKGETNYNADGIVLILQFSRSLVYTEKVVRCELSCAMEMGLL